MKRLAIYLDSCEVKWRILQKNQSFYIENKIILIFLRIETVKVVTKF